MQNTQLFGRHSLLVHRSLEGHALQSAGRGYKRQRLPICRLTSGRTTCPVGSLFALSLSVSLLRSLFSLSLCGESKGKQWTKTPVTITNNKGSAERRVFDRKRKSGGSAAIGSELGKQGNYSYALRALKIGTGRHHAYARLAAEAYTHRVHF